jgi:uncharacterized protein (DUF58 family)
MSRLEFVARQVVEGVITGQHKSPHRGFSVEFSEHREYTPGDELRHLDWRAYARSDRYYIKLFEQETNLRATLVVDTSNSMRFAQKMDYAKHLAACIAYLLSLQQDLAGLVAVDEQVRVELPPGSSAPHLDRLFRALEGITPTGTTDLAQRLHHLCESAPRRSLFVLISDLWLDGDALVRALQHARYRRHQLMVIHLLDKAEIDLPYDQQITLHDLETDEKLEIDPADLRPSYKAQVDAHLERTRKACTDAGAEYHRLFVDVPYDRALISLMHRRG